MSAAAPASSSSPTPPPSPAPTASGRPPRKRGIKWVVAAIGLAIAVVAGGIYWHRDERLRQYR